MRSRFKLALLLATSLCAPPAFAATCSTGTPNYLPGDGGFGILLGQMYAPNGSVFVPHGVNVIATNLTVDTANQLLSMLPGLNYIRVPVFTYSDPSTWSAAVQLLTSHGVVLEFEDHQSSDGQDKGGGTGSVFTGQKLQDELAWQTKMGQYYASNPYVWMGADNEPPGGDMPGLVAWEQQQYAAWRSGGNNSPFLLEPAGGGVPGTFGAGTGFANVAANMTNVGIDVHYYGWAAKFSTDQSAVNQAWSNLVSAARSMNSQDGPLWVVAGEVGDSTDGQNVDANGAQAVQAVEQSGVGSAAWAWMQGAADALLSGNGLSPFGRQVANYIASSGATGCALPPIPIPTSAPAVASNDLSVADVAALAAQGLTASGQPITDTAQLAAMSVGQGGALPNDPNVAAVLASGPAPVVKAPVRTVDAPGGMASAPSPVSNTISLNAAADFQTIVTGSGNVTGTVSGNQDTISATGGIATITVTGSGNTITTGPYADTITVRSAGNIINGGGGNDTIVLAYPGTTVAALAINADAAALPPLASAGNVFVAPAPGTGILTLQGTMTSADRIDVTKALVGLAGYNGANVWQFLTATTSPQGCVLAVSGKPIVVLQNGSPEGNIGPFVTAAAP